MNSKQVEKRDAADLYKGIIPPMALPLSESGDIDFESLRSQVRFLMEAGADGLWVNGTTGDFFALREEEASEVVSAVCEFVAGRIPVIAQVGDTSTRLVVSHARKAVAAGADAVSLVPPYYVDYSQQELKRHYRRISREIGQPVFVYQIPQMTKVSLTVPSLVELAGEGAVVGIKDSAGNLDFYGRLVRAVAREGVVLRCFYGFSALVDLSLFVGGHGIMCGIANLVPHLCKEVYVTAMAGEWEKTRQAMSKIVDLIDALTLPGRSNWAPTVAGYKWILKRLGVIASDHVFEPLETLTPEEEAHLEKRALPLARKFCSGRV